jgi:hypothetical protein
VIAQCSWFVVGPDEISFAIIIMTRLNRLHIPLDKLSVEKNGMDSIHFFLLDPDGMGYKDYIGQAPVE